MTTPSISKITGSHLQSLPSRLHQVLSSVPHLPYFQTSTLWLLSSGQDSQFAQLICVEKHLHSTDSPTNPVFGNLSVPYEYVSVLLLNGEFGNILNQNVEILICQQKYSHMFRFLSTMLLCSSCAIPHLGWRRAISE